MRMADKAVCKTYKTYITGVLKVLKVLKVGKLSRRLYLLFVNNSAGANGLLWLHREPTRDTPPARHMGPSGAFGRHPLQCDIGDI